MPSTEEIQRYLVGGWRLMLGKADGLKAMDLSADGFWDSFFAVVVALPPLIAGWVSYTNEVYDAASPFGERLSFVLRLAAADIGAWVLPLLLLAVVAPYARIADRFVPYVVATNWASALLMWLMLPTVILRMLVPSSPELVTFVSLVFFIGSMALTWRMTNVVIAKGAAIGTAVFAGMFVASLAVLFTLQSLLGLYVSDPLG